MTKIAAVLALVVLSACNTARTAYSVDHTKSWMCAPNTRVQYPPLPSGEPMVMLETAQEQKIAERVMAEERKAAQAAAAKDAQVASAPK